jgi:transitional endoplasmic reticulum ATPase
MTTRARSGARPSLPDMAAAMLSGDALMSLLAHQLTGGPQVTEGEGLEFHPDPTTHKIIVPQGWSYERIREAVDRAEKEMETKTQWNRVFEYLPDDGAYALMQVLKARYGGAVGEATMTFFGPEPPELDTIDIAYGVTAQVPRGRLSLPALPGLIVNSAGMRKPGMGVVFAMSAEGPRKYKEEVEGIFKDIEEYLATNSIYRGAAVQGTKDLRFINISTFPRHEIVFAKAAEELLLATLWGPLHHWREMEAEGIPLKRAVILHGPYGTGKTSAGMITAQIAARAGWTYIAARAGRDSVVDALETAKKYQPAVVFVEDFDNEGTDGDDSAAMSKLLEAFDGATAKGSKVMVVVTTNHVERIPRGMLRPGRFDAMIPIAHLDPEGIEKLIKAVVSPDKLRADIDYAAVTEAMAGFYPAFVREAVDRARIVAIGRHGRAYALDTAALVVAARSLAEQLQYLEDAGEGVKKPTLDVALRSLVRDSLTEIPLKVQGSQDFYIVEPGSKRDDNSPDYIGVGD